MDVLRFLVRSSALSFTLYTLLAGQYRELRIEPVDPAVRRSFDKQVKVALIVGVGTYPQGSGVSSLKYAVRDADTLEAALRSQGYLVRKLVDSGATRAVIRRTLRELSDVVSPDEGTLLFFFAGHGFSHKGVNYLATFGVTADDLEGEGLPVRDVEALLRAATAKRKLMFIDACRSDPGQARSADQRSFDKLQASEGIRALFSTREGRLSYEDDALRQGIFTYFLVKGLEGEAAGADGLVTFRDLADYLTDRMRAYTIERGQMQIPFEAGESSGDFLLSAGNTASRTEPPAPCPGMDRMASFLGDRDPSLPPAAREAEVRLRQGDAQSALQLYEQAAAATPGDWFLLLRTGEVYLQLGRVEDAIAAFGRSNAIRETAVAYASMGAALELRSDDGKAVQSYRKALQLCPENPDLYIRLAFVCSQVGNYDEALGAIWTGLQKPPLKLVANPVAGSLEDLDQMNKTALDDILTDVFVARGMYEEAAFRLRERKVIGIGASEVPEGIRIARVKKGYPADLAGLSRGDVLVKFNGVSLAGMTMADFAGKIVQAPAFGTAVKATVTRSGRKFDTAIIVGITPDLPAASRTAR